MQDEEKIKKNLYQMTIERNIADEMVSRFSRFYVNKQSAAGLDNFVHSFYGTLKSQSIPWLDIPFYINSFDSTNFPKSLRSEWMRNSLVGDPNLPPEKRGKASIDYFLDNKQEIIQFYMELLEIYLSRNNASINMLTINSIARALQMENQKEELQDELEKQITLYNILGNIRIKEKDFTRFLAKNRIKRPSGLHSDVAFKKDAGKQTGVTPRPVKTEADQKKPPKVTRKATTKIIAAPSVEKEKNLAEDDIDVGLPNPEAKTEQKDEAQPTITKEPVTSQPPDSKNETAPKPSEEEAKPADTKKDLPPEGKQETPVQPEKASEVSSEEVDKTEDSEIKADEAPIDCMALYNQIPPAEDTEENPSDSDIGDNMFTDETGAPPTELANKKTKG